MYGDGSQKTISAKRFCISTGSKPAVPPVEGLKETAFITNEEVFHLRRLPEKLIVLGGGPIGLELGQSFARFGSEVTIVEMDNRVIPKEDEEISATVEEIMRAEGLRILLKTKVVRSATANGQKLLTVEHDGQRSSYRPMSSWSAPDDDRILKDSTPKPRA